MGALTVVERFDVVEDLRAGLGARGKAAAIDQFQLVAHVQLVLNLEFQELLVAQATGGGFLQAHVQSLQQTGVTVADGATVRFPPYHNMDRKSTTTDHDGQHSPTKSSGWRCSRGH